MIYAGAAFMTGLAAWTALQMYYRGRSRNRAAETEAAPQEPPDREISGNQDRGGQPCVRQPLRNAVSKVRTAWILYLAKLKTRKGALLFLAGAAGMIFCYCMARYYGLTYINCIRNELVFVWLVPVALIDAGEQVIPHGLTVPGFVAWIVFVLLAVGIGGGSLRSVLVFSMGGCLMGGGMFFLCRLVTRGGVGMGDVRAFGILGLLYGMNYTFSIVFFTILLMTVYGAAAVIGRRKDIKSQVPMGPFILASFTICCLLGV